MWIIYYLVGSLIAAAVSLAVVTAAVAPFFKGISRLTSKSQSSSDRER